MKKIANAVWFLLIFSISGFAVTEAEYDSAYSLYQNTQENGSWKHSWYHVIGDYDSVCDQYGIVCTTTTPKHIIEINENDNNLKGDLNNVDFSGLNWLLEFNLQNNQLYGDIPLEITALNTLITLNLSYNGFNGKIPWQIRNLNTLTTLNLSHNQFNNILPKFCTSSSCLTKLITLNLSNNMISGDFWDINITGCSKLKTFNVGFNELKDAVRSEIMKHPSLEYINLEHNQLWGILNTISTSNEYLKYLNLGDNDLHGTLPDTIALHFPNLETLDVRRNNFSGVVPANLNNLNNLKVLQLERNDFSGPIPTLDKLVKLEALHLDHNSFTGTIPDYIGSNLLQLTELHLDSNELTGSIPITFEYLLNLESLYLYGNHLTGNIPSELGWLQKLRYLNLSNNNLSGTIPNLLGYIGPQLYYLNLSYNSLAGIIPDNLSLLSGLEYINLTYNFNLISYNDDLKTFIDSHGGSYEDILSTNKINVLPTIIMYLLD